MFDRKKHKEIMRSFLKYLNNVSNDYILKDGTALMFCYNLDRFSEDIDLDSANKGAILKITDRFCSKYGLSYRAAKDTNTVKRYLIDYGGSKKLKVEISYRSGRVTADRVTKINGILVYKLDSLFSMKLSAFLGRSKLRDMYDICFMYKRYKRYIQKEQIYSLADALAFRRIEYYDFLISEQSDELIDNNKLANDYLDMFNDLGLI